LSGTPGGMPVAGPSATYTIEFPDSETSSAINFAARKDPIPRKNMFYGLCYSPDGLRDNRFCPPFDDVRGICLLPGQFLADIRTISSVAKRVKIYSLYCFDASQVVLEYAKASGVTVMLVIYISKDQKHSDKELSYFKVSLKCTQVLE
jgi:hypothetical protein